MNLVETDNQATEAYMAMSTEDLHTPEDLQTPAEDLHEEPEVVSYTYRLAESDECIDAETLVWDEPELTLGAVVHTEKEGQAKKFYTVHALHEAESENSDVTVELSEAKSIIWSMLLLGGLLVASWFGLDYLIGVIW